MAAISSITAAGAPRIIDLNDVILDKTNAKFSCKIATCFLTRFQQRQLRRFSISRLKSPKKMAPGFKHNTASVNVMLN